MPEPDNANSSLSVPHLCGLLLGALGIAFAPIFVVLANRFGGVGMWDAAFWRVFIGALVMGAFLGLRGKSLLPEKGKATNGWMWLWFPGVLFGADFWVWHWSFDHTTVANSTLLANTSILWVTLFAWWVWKERITKLFVWGALVAFAGMALLVLSSANREPPANGSPVFGDGLALATAFFYGSYQLSIKRYRREHSAPVLLFWASLIAAIVLFPVALLQSDPFLSKNAAGWWMLIGVGVVSHACGQGLIAWSLGSLPSSLAAVLLLTQPVLTAFLGVALLGQKLVPWQIGGAALVVTGLFFAVRGQIRR